jgi:hypothetical protein
MSQNPPNDPPSEDEHQSMADKIEEDAEATTQSAYLGVGLIILVFVAVLGSIAAFIILRVTGLL